VRSDRDTGAGRLVSLRCEADLQKPTANTFLTYHATTSLSLSKPLDQTIAPKFEIIHTSLEPGLQIYAFASKCSHESAIAEHALADVRQAMPKSRNLSFVEGASVPISASTAWQALFDHGHIRMGQKLLITGAAGGTGLWAVRFGRE
jgi:NADPH-dependent curcumin reductase CurA